jgi:glyoxylase-like metal-dependent hydrolase (beta-lactamase superfamily II)
MAHSSSIPHVVDLMFLGRPGLIATGVIRTPVGALLVDPGPAPCLSTLDHALAGLGIAPGDVHGLLLTHIHLDHAGAAGTMVRRHPHLQVFVHERGAPHLIDPARLLASAGRLYGDDMDRLWGEFAPVPAANVHVPEDGEVLTFGDVEIDVAHTRGHASHHVCYRDRRSGIVYAGDTGGIRVGPSAYVLPPTPPPDIDLQAWQASLDRIRAWSPAGVFVTHFGLYPDAEAHLAALGGELTAWGRLSADIVAGERDEAVRMHRFVEAVRARIRERVTPEEADAYRDAMSLEDCWKGLARYWQTKSR